jgi:hypothetical protein
MSMPTTTGAPGAGQPAGPATDREIQSWRQRGRDQRRAKVAGKAERHRYAVVYDVDGPRVRLGLAWFLLLCGSMVWGIAALALVYAVAATLAAYQLTDVWSSEGEHPNQIVAVVGAGSIVAASVLGPVGAGVAVLSVTVLALLGATTSQGSRAGFFAAAGTTVRCSVYIAVAAAAPVLSFEIHPGAAATLVVFASVYEMGDYLVGSGSSNAVEGPVAGMAAIAVFTFALWVAAPPPFEQDIIPALGVMAAVFAPFGQLIGSAILPAPGAPAPALRRLDTLLVLGPVWLAAMWLFVQ